MYSAEARYQNYDSKILDALKKDNEVIGSKEVLLTNFWLDQGNQLVNHKTYRYISRIILIFL